MHRQISAQIGVEWNPHACGGAGKALKGAGLRITTGDGGVDREGSRKGSGHGSCRQAEKGLGE